MRTLVLVSALIVAGCGGGDDDSEPAEPTMVNASRFASEEDCIEFLQAPGAATPDGDDGDLTVINDCRASGYDPVFAEHGILATSAHYDAWRENGDVPPATDPTVTPFEGDAPDRNDVDTELERGVLLAKEMLGLSINPTAAEVAALTCPTSTPAENLLLQLMISIDNGIEPSEVVLQQIVTTLTSCDEGELDAAATTIAAATGLPSSYINAQIEKGNQILGR